MLRHALAGAVAIVLIPVVLAAQTTLTIEASSIDVYEFPAAAARVIAQVHQGRVLQVAREEGDWVTVVWPETAAGVGFVRLKVGSLASTEANGESSVSHVRADVEAVERAIFAIWAARSHPATALHGEASR
jgi:hypothetical protein